MKILLDTHTLLWTLADDKMISEVKNQINDGSNEVYVSVASLWEIEIKHSTRADSMPFSSKDILNILKESGGFILLPIKQEHISNIGYFIKQNIHKDPFDHLLLSVAYAEDIFLLSHDEKMSKYQGVKLLTY